MELEIARFCLCLCLEERQCYFIKGTKRSPHLEGEFQQKLEVREGGLQMSKGRTFASRGHSSRAVEYFILKFIKS